MSKYCRPMGLYVTYLDCMECEDKECITKREEQINGLCWNYSGYTSRWY